MEDQSGTIQLMVCEALRAATDANHQLVRKAEEQLKQWESQPGFFLTLTRVCMSMFSGVQQLPLDVNVRWMAAVYLKNGINRYWRSKARNELQSNEKQEIRHLLLMNFAKEPIPQISTQIAVIMSMIARFDYPLEWPNLLVDILNRLEALVTKPAAPAAAAAGGGGGATTTVDEVQRIMLVLHHIIKALASKRMLADRKAFEELTKNIYEFIFKLYDTQSNQFCYQLKASPVMAKATIEKAILSVRILRKLTVYGIAKVQKSEISLRFIETLFVHLKLCLNYRYELRQFNADEDLISQIEKLILKQIKTIMEFKDTHRLAFKQFVPLALQFSFDHVFHCKAYLIFTNNVINFRQFAIHSINLMKSIVTPTYTERIQISKLDADNDGNENGGSSVTNVIEQFFSADRLSYICEKIITHYFLLTQIELNLWLENPEEFASDDNGGDSWKYALRPCIENLFVSFFGKYQTEMTAELVKYIRKMQEIPLSMNSDLKDILLKDAIYNAAGLTAVHLFSEIDFDAWFSGQLINEINIDSYNSRIIRRRIIWLLGEWAVVKFSQNLQPLAYETCIRLLRSSEDMPIRLAASQTLTVLISDVDFIPTYFIPYLEAAFNAQYCLLCEAQECDTKLKILGNMSNLIEQMSDSIEPQINKLMTYLPLLWTESNDYNMLRCAVISTLTQIVKAIREVPEKIGPFLYSVISLSTDIKEPAHIYLIEESLLLWVAVVEYSTTMSTSLMDLCRNIMPILELSTENLGTLLILIQAYILLDTHAFLDRYGQPFITFCSRMLDDIRPDGSYLIMKVLETCLKADPMYGLELIRPTLLHIFRQVYLNNDIPLLVNMNLMMLARVLLISQTVFMQVVQQLQYPNSLETILDMWITQMPLVTEVEKRKLICLAFLSIFSNTPVVVKRFVPIMQYISDTLFQIMCEDDSDGESPRQSTSNHRGDGKSIKYCDSLVFADEYDLDTSKYCTMDNFDYKTYHYDRCRQLSLQDPVHKISLPQFTEWHLMHLRSQMSADDFKQLMNTIPSQTLENINKFIPLQNCIR